MPPCGATNDAQAARFVVEPGRRHEATLGIDDDAGRPQIDHVVTGEVGPDHIEERGQGTADGTLRERL